MNINPMIYDIPELIEKRPIVFDIVKNIIKQFEQQDYHRVVRAFQSASRLYIGVGEFGMNGHMYVKVNDMLNFLRSIDMSKEGTVSYHPSFCRSDIQFVRQNISDYVSVLTLSEALAWYLNGGSHQLSMKPLEQLFSILLICNPH
ncbi:hypothetical protein ACBZ91_18530 [Vibrio natriegens]|uniref:hypothetical protein n=1 Tax=Vibrio natriegens TaxID=691 RepID=UPI00355807A9